MGRSLPHRPAGRPRPGPDAAVRWLSALIFVAFGAGKFLNHGPELASFRSYGLPAPSVFVLVIGALEIVGGAALACGIGVRVAAAALALDMAGAIVVSGLVRGEAISLTLAPALLIAMLWLLWQRSGLRPPGSWRANAPRTRAGSPRTGGGDPPRREGSS